MASNAITMSSDSQNPVAPLTCSADERPPVTISAMGQGYLDEELETARRDWLNALMRIPTRPGFRRNNAIAKEQQLKRHYERLLGHPAGKD